MQRNNIVMKNLENTEKWSKLELLYGGAIDMNI